MRNVPTGTKGTFSFTVADQHLANATNPADPILLPVLASKEMIVAMEFAAMDARRPFLDPGETSGGNRLQHPASGRDAAGPSRTLRSRIVEARRQKARVQRSRVRRER
jgi:predicted thioesterase